MSVILASSLPVPGSQVQTLSPQTGPSRAIWAKCRRIHVPFEVHPDQLGNGAGIADADPRIRTSSQQGLVGAEDHRIYQFGVRYARKLLVEPGLEIAAQDLMATGARSSMPVATR
jgi:hypothetical protein